MKLSAIVTPLLNWYSENARMLPWRENPTPYRVWVSEIMLQQTRVEAAKEYYLRFMNEFPTIQDLASASEERLLKCWEGLGYYSRARNLHKTAQRIVAEYEGIFPADYQSLRDLPGVGEYTVGALRSIAFGFPEPAVDGNVLRVVSRFTGLRDNIQLPMTRNQVREALRAVYPAGKCSEFTQALMELGAIVCIPGGEPHCLLCPLGSSCYANQKHCWNELPVKNPPKGRKIEERTVFLLRFENKIALCKRPERGLLAGMWEFPNVLTENAETFLMSCPGEKESKAIKAKHIFSHIEWHMHGYFVHCRSCNPQFIWVTKEELQTTYALPSAFDVFRKAFYLAE